MISGKNFLNVLRIYLYYTIDVKLSWLVWGNNEYRITRNMILQLRLRLRYSSFVGVCLEVDRNDVATIFHKEAQF